MTEPLSEKPAAPASGAQQQALLNLAVSQSSAIFYLADLAGDRPIRFISSNVETITGHKPAAFLGDARYGRERIHPDDIDGYEARLKLLRARGALTHEYRFQCRNGEYRWFRDELRVIEGGDGAPGEFVGCMIDVTERVAAEQESRRLSGLLRHAVESIPNGFGIYDGEEKLTLCNKAFASLIGETPEALVGSSAIDNTRKALGQLLEFDGKRVGDAEATLPRALARVREAEREPIEMQLKSGQWLQITSHPIADGGRVDIRTDITRLKQAEASLRESEEQFRSIVEANPSPVRVADFETWDILYESPAAAALFGRPWPSKQGRSTVESYGEPEAREELIGILRKDRRVDNYEVLMRRASGATFWVSLSSRVVRYRDKDVCVTSLVDLTDTKKREAELGQARETLEDMIEALSEGLALYDADDRLVTCNTQYRVFQGDSADLLVPGASWRDVTRKRAERGHFLDAVGRVEEWLEEQFDRRITAVNEEFAFAGDRWFEYSHRPTRQGGFVTTWRDISERKRMEESLRESAEMIRRVLEACPLPIRMWNPESGAVIYESPACTAVFRRNGQELTADDRLTTYVDPRDRDRYLRQIRAAGAVDDMEMLLRRRDGTTFWASVSARLIDYRDDEVVVSSIVDLTDRRAAEAELSRQRDMLHQSEKLSALGELLAGVSHELNNPLSVLVGQAHLLQESAPDERVAARAERIGKAADRCARIVRTFLTMARQEPSASAPVDLNALIESSLEVTAYSLRTSGIEVSRRLARNLPTVMADPDQMRQVLTNLIVNAEHALHDVTGARKLRVVSSYREKSKQVVIKIKDNGPGIQDEIRGRIFEPLFTTKGVGKGTGIGLALCHRIVVAHGGTIEVESAPGDGAAFAIRLPVGEPSRGHDAAAQTRGGNSAVYRVLVVDDEADVGQTISDVLELDGHRVEIAHSGDAAMELIGRNRYDVILSDIRMRGMDGPGLYRALSDRAPELVETLAFITGDTLSPRVREFLARVQRPYLEKPIMPSDVRDLVALLMRGKDG